MTLRLRCDGLEKGTASRFEEAVLSVPGVGRVDTWRGGAEVEAADGVDASAVIAALAAAGFRAREDADEREVRLHVDGMTCRSCEITVERRFGKLAGVKKVVADAAGGAATLTVEGRGPGLAALQAAIEKDGYRVRASGAPAAAADRPSALRLAALFGAVLLMGASLSKLGVFDRGYELGGGSNFMSALLIGLLAGSSSCVAVSGGLLLSSAKRFRDRYGGGTALDRLRPTAMFVAGRILSYAAFGGVIGAVGAALDPSPAITGGLIIVAAVYMFIMGLDMLQIAPSWLKRLMPRMPKSISHRVLDAEGREHPVMPAMLGAATFFLPCGFTQALQLYALSSGSFAAGAAVLGGFAVGTAPVLLGLGWASTSLKGKAGTLFFQFSGALVVVLGLWNVQNGLTIAGHPLSLPELSLASGRAADKAPAADDPNVVFDGKTQLIKMTLAVQDPFYLPSDRFTVRAGVPVRMEINGYGTGCRSYFVIPKLGVKTALNKPQNIVEFTPDRPGTYSFSCSMGMFPGTLVVVGS